MKKTLKISLFSLGGLILLMGTLVLLIINLDPAYYRSFLAQKVAEKTGRTFEMGQDLKIHYYPWLSIETSGMVLGNAKGFEGDPFFTVDHFMVRVKLLPLLKRQLEMDIVTLQGARIHLARNKAGRSNWEDLVPRPASTKSTGFDMGNLAVLLKGGVKVQDAVISLDDQSLGKIYQVSELNITTGPLDPGEPVDLSIAFNTQTNMPEVSGNFSLDAAVFYNPDLERYQIRPLEAQAKLKGPGLGEDPVLLTLTSAVEMDLERDMVVVRDLHATGLGTTLEGMVSIRRFQSGPPLVDTDLRIKGQDLARVFRVLEAGPLAERLAKLPDKRFDLKTRMTVDMDPGTVDLPDLEIQMLGASIKGEVQAGRIQSATPSLKGNLIAKGPDLPFLLQVAGWFEGKNSRLALLGKRLAKSENRNFHMETRFDADLKTGKMDIPQFSLQAPGLTMEALVTADRINTRMPSVKGQFKAKGPDLPLLVELAGLFQGKDSSLGNLSRQLTLIKPNAFHADMKMDMDMAKGRVQVTELSIAGLGISLTGTVHAQDLGSDKALVEGQLSLEGNQVTQLLKALDQGELADRVQSISLRAGIKGNLQALQVSPLWASAGLSGSLMPPAQVVLDSVGRVNVNDQTLALDSFSLKGLGLEARGSLRAEKILESPVYSGKFSLAPFDLTALMKKLNQPLQATQDPTVFKKLELFSDFSGSAAEILLKNLTLIMDQSQAQGEFGIKNFQDPSVWFDLAIDRLNMDRYLPAVQERGEKSGKTGKGLGGEPSQNLAATPETLLAAAALQIPVETLRAFKARGKLTLEELIVSNARLHQVKVNLDAQDGKITLAPLSAALYQGSYTGKLLLDVTGKLPRLNLESALKGVELEPLLNDYTGSARIRGRGDMTAALTTSGRDGEAMKRNVNGPMSFVFKNGAVKGFNAGKFLRSLKSLRDNQSLQVAEEEETDFTALTGNPLVKNGVVILNDLEGKSPALRVTGTGILADIVQETIDYKAMVTVVETSKGQAGKELAELAGITIPIYIRGPVADPTITPDIGSVISILATREIMEKLSKKLDIKTPEPVPAQDTQEQKTKEPPLSDPLNQLKKSIEKELGNILKGLSN